MVAGGGDDVERSRHIRLERLAGMDVRVRDSDQGAEVEDEIGAPHRVLHRIGVAKVAQHRVDRVPDVRVGMLDPAEAASRGVTEEAAHVRSELHEPFDEVAADEAAGTGHEHPPSAPVVSARRPPGHGASISGPRCRRNRYAGGRGRRKIR